VFSYGLLGTLGALIVSSLVINAMVYCNNDLTLKLNRISALYDGLKLSNFHSINYTTYGLIRRALLVAMLIFLKEYQLLHIFLFNLH